MMSESTIFKRHESRNSKHAQISTTLATAPMDSSFLETLANMGSRSSIYRMHERRNSGASSATAVAAAAATTTTMPAVNNYANGVSFNGMNEQSTIFQRNARRASR